MIQVTFLQGFLWTIVGVFIGGLTSVAMYKAGKWPFK